MLITKKEIKKWLDKYDVVDYTINKDLTVDVNGDVDLSLKELEAIEVQFGRVEGEFNCGRNLLTSLEGSPYHVGKRFNCSMNELTNLDFAPQFVGANLTAYFNPITHILNLKTVYQGLLCLNSNIEDTDEFIPFYREDRLLNISFEKFQAVWLKVNLEKKLPDSKTSPKVFKI